MGKKKRITKLEVEDLLKNPEQIVPGDMDTWIGQSRKHTGLLRVPFKEIGDARKVITVYWTSRVEKH